MELLMSRSARTKIPTSPKLLKPKVVKGVNHQLQKNKDKQKYYYDKHAKTLKPLKPHDQVRMSHGNKWVPATVISTASTPRSYIVQTQDGHTYRRNRRHILKTNEQLKENTDQTDDIAPVQQPLPKQNYCPRRSTRIRVQPERYSDCYK